MMRKVLSNRYRSIAYGSLVLGIQACGCDGVACIDGLFVSMTSLPAAPFKVELLVAGVVQASPEEATCNVGASRPCVQTVLFRMRPRDQVSVRVTTSTGVRTTDLPRINYSNEGTGCSDCMGQAEVSVHVP